MDILYSSMILLVNFNTAISILKNYTFSFNLFRREDDFMNYIDLGKRIKEERNKLNLTQEQLAEYADISTSYMGQIERGERKVTLETLIKVTNKLNVSIDYLLKDSINITSDNSLEQIKQLFANKDLSSKNMAIDVVRVMFSHLED